MQTGVINSENVSSVFRQISQTRKQGVLEITGGEAQLLVSFVTGKIVDAVIENLLPHLEKDDIIIDGGNSYFTDTDRRESYLSEKGIHFFGAGVSGGAKGATTLGKPQSASIHHRCRRHAHLRNGLSRRRYNFLPESL